MAGTKSRRPTDAIIKKWLRAGYGQGEGTAYKPFHYVRDVPSLGTSNMVNSLVTGRNHHYLSRQELKVHFLAEYSPSILDIREQFALLPREETQSIAHRLGIRHPTYPSTDVFTVMTTDLVLSMRRKDGIELIAVSVKLTKDLTPRNLEKLLIERVYWNRRGVRWILATEKNIPGPRAHNLQFFESALKKPFTREFEAQANSFAQLFEKNHAPHLNFNEILARSAQDVGVDNSSAQTLLASAVWRRKSRIDIDAAPLSHRSPVALTR